MPEKKKSIKVPHKTIPYKPPKLVEWRDVDTYLLQARTYPYGECWLETRFRTEGSGLTQVMVTRVQPNDRLVFAIFVVDLLCLGVKDCFYNMNYSKANFKRKLEMVAIQRELITPAYANGLIYGAIDFAARFGLPPHALFEKASLVLDPPGTYPPPEDIEFGQEGKPVFIPGPYDDMDKILDQLRQTVGEGNFGFLYPL